MSKAVLPENCAKELLQHETVGNKIYQEFVQTRLQEMILSGQKSRKENLKLLKLSLK